MAKNYDERLPDVRCWQPVYKNNDTLKNALETTCQLIQHRITSRSEAESKFNINNFDSGVGVEDIVREELTSLLPGRYLIASGVVSDRYGKTAGDCDLVIRDRIWSPAIKLGATKMSRRYHFPIEGVYSASEIKQTLGFAELDAAMKKLVILSRLERPCNPFGHITENQHLQCLDRPEAILNPLHTSILAIGLPKGISFSNIVARFGKINALLGRDEMINMLCVLDQGTAWYSVKSGSPNNANYMTDRQESLILQINDGEPQNTFYRLYRELLGHLSRSVLGLVNLEYGSAPLCRRTVSYKDAKFNLAAE